MRNKTKKVLNRFAFIMTMLMLFTISFGIVFTGITIKPDLGIGELSSEFIQNNNVANAAADNEIITTPTTGKITNLDFYTESCSIDPATNITQSFNKKYVFSYPHVNGQSTKFTNVYYNATSNNKVKSADSGFWDREHYIIFYWDVIFDNALYDLMSSGYVTQIQFSLRASYVNNDNFPRTTFKLSNGLNGSGEKRGSKDLTLSFTVNKNTFDTSFTKDSQNKKYSGNLSLEMHREGTQAHMECDIKSASVSLTLDDTIKPNFSVDLNHTKGNKTGTLVTFNDAGVGIKSIKAYRHELNKETKEYILNPTSPYILYNHQVVTNGAPKGTDFAISPGTQNATWFIPREVEACKGFYKYEVEDHFGNIYTLGEQTAFTGVNINFTGGDGSKVNPFVLSNINDFNELASLVNRGYSFKELPYFVIDPDNQFSQSSQFINLNGFSKSIGDDTHPFSGIILGKKSGDAYIHADICNLSIPLFGTIKRQTPETQGLDPNGVVSNLKISTGGINTNVNTIGAIAKKLVGGEISYCENNINITANACVGGIVGEISENAKVKGCKNTGTIITNGITSVDGDGAYLGGIVGVSNIGNISNCYNSGNVKVSSEYTSSNVVGGIVGYTTGNVTYCYNSGQIEGSDYVGGVVGRINGGASQYLYSEGKIIPKWNNSGAKINEVAYVSTGTKEYTWRMGVRNSSPNSATIQEAQLIKPSGETLFPACSKENTGYENFDSILNHDIDSFMIKTEGYNKVFDIGAGFLYKPIKNTQNDSYMPAFELYFRANAAIPKYLYDFNSDDINKQSKEFDGVALSINNRAYGNITVSYTITTTNNEAIVNPTNGEIDAILTAKRNDVVVGRYKNIKAEILPRAVKNNEISGFISILVGSNLETVNGLSRIKISVDSINNQNTQYLTNDFYDLPVFFKNNDLAGATFTFKLKLASKIVLNSQSDYDIIANPLLTNKEGLQRVTIRLKGFYRGEYSFDYLAYESDFGGKVNNGWGTNENPYLINSKQHLINLSDIVNKVRHPLDSIGDNCASQQNNFKKGHFKLNANIDLINVPMRPIGIYVSDSDVRSFNGHFDGNSKTISNLTIGQVTLFNGTVVKDRIGLFGYAINSHIKNLALTSTNITGHDYVGSIVGYGQNVKIDGCSNNGVVKGNNYIGGIAGLVYATEQNYNVNNIYNCENTGTVEGNEHVGGIVGEIGLMDKPTTIINHCTFNENSIVKGNKYLGGIVGSTLGDQNTAKNAFNIQILHDLTNNGTVQTLGNAGSTDVGGIVGQARDASYIGTFTNNGQINASVASNVGGIIGYVFGNKEITGISTNTNITFLNTNKISGKDNTGGLIGQLYYASFTYNSAINNGEVLSGGDCVGGIIGVGIDHAEIFNNDDTVRIKNTGKVTGNDNVGGVFGKTAQRVAFVSNTGVISGNNNIGGIVGNLVAPGTIENVINGESANSNTISGTANIGGIVGRTEGNITGTISTTGVGVDFVDSNWGTINYAIVQGTGNFIGGIIGIISKDGITISNCLNLGAISGSGGSLYVGGILGAAETSDMVNCPILHCQNEGNVKALNCVGGIAGWAKQNISYCANTGTISGTDAESSKTGGIVGMQRGYTTQYCKNSGTIEGSGSYCGGIVGWAEKLTIKNCKNTGFVHFIGAGDKFAFGGIVGYVEGNSTITYNRNEGEVEGKFRVGGIAGTAKDSKVSNNVNYTTENNINIHWIRGTATIGGIVGRAQTCTEITGNKNLNAHIYASGSRAEEKCYYNTGESPFVGSYAAGIVGVFYNYNTKIKLTHCYNSGKVTAAHHLNGGIVGFTFEGIQYCANAGDLTAPSDTGGIAGSMGNHTMEYCYTININITCQEDAYVGTALGYYRYGSVIQNTVAINTTRNHKGGKDLNSTFNTSNLVKGTQVEGSIHEIKGYYYGNNDDVCVPFEDITKWDIQGVVAEYSIKAGYYYNSNYYNSSTKQWEFKEPHKLDNEVVLANPYVVGVRGYYGAGNPNIKVDIANIESTSSNIKRDYTGEQVEISTLNITKPTIPNYIVEIGEFKYGGERVDHILDAGDYKGSVVVYLKSTLNHNDKFIVGISDDAKGSINITVNKINVSNFKHSDINLTYNAKNQKPNFTLTWKPGYVWSFTYAGGTYTAKLQNGPTNFNKDNQIWTIPTLTESINYNGGLAYKIVFKAKEDSNFTGSYTLEFIINQKSITDTDFKYTNEEVNFEYKGIDQYVKVTFTWGEEYTWTIADGKITSLNTLESISIVNATGKDAGEYTLSIVGSNNFKGTKDITWTIKPYDISGTNSKCEIEKYEYGTVENYINTIYESDANKTVEYVGEYYNVYGSLTIEGIHKFTFEGNSFISSTNPKDTLSITGASGIDAKQYTLTISGSNNFEGTKTLTWKITPRKIDDIDFKFTIEDKQKYLEYNFQIQGPVVNLIWGNIDINPTFLPKIWSFEFANGEYGAIGGNTADGFDPEKKFTFNTNDLDAFTFEFFKVNVDENGNKTIDYNNLVKPIDVGKYVLRINRNKYAKQQNFEITEKLPTIEFDITPLDMKKLTILVDYGHVKLGNSKIIDINGKKYYYLSNIDSQEKSLIHSDDLIEKDANGTFKIKEAFVQHTAVALIDRNGSFVLDNTNGKHYSYSIKKDTSLDVTTSNVTTIDNLIFDANKTNGNLKGTLSAYFYAMQHDFASGSGKVDDPYIISNWQEAIRLAELTNGQSFAGAPVEPWLSDASALPYDTTSGFYKIYFKISTPNKDILTLNYSDGFRPIGRKEHTFKGSLTGNKINIRLDLAGCQDMNNVGLFGIFEGEKLCDIVMQNVAVKGSKNVGAIAGQMLKGNVYGIIAAYSSDTDFGQSYVEGTANVGGLFGKIKTTAGTTNGENNYFGRVSSTAVERTVLINEANVTNSNTDIAEGLHTGGIIGLIEKDRSSNNNQVFEAVCQNTGSVTSKSSFVGGLIGYVGENVQINLKPYNNSITTITNFSGISGSKPKAISGKSNVGGLIGYLPQTSDKINHVIESAYCLNMVIGTISNIGGLIGEMHGGSIKNSFFLPGDGVINTGNITIPSGKNSNNVGGLVGYMAAGNLTNSLASGFDHSCIAQTRGGTVGLKDTTATISNTWVIYAVNKGDKTGKEFNSTNANDIQYIVVENGALNALNINRQIANIGVDVEDFTSTISDSLYLEFVVPLSQQLVFYDLDYTNDTIPENGKFNTKLVEDGAEYSNKIMSRIDLTNSRTNMGLGVELKYAFVLNQPYDTIEIGVFNEPITFKDISIKTPEEYTTKYNVPLKNANEIGEAQEGSNEYYYFTATNVNIVNKENLGNKQSGVNISGQVNFNWKINPKSVNNIQIVETAPNSNLDMDSSPNGSVVITLSNGKTITSTKTSWKDVFADLVTQYNNTYATSPTGTDKTAIYSSTDAQKVTHYYLRDFTGNVDFKELNVIVGMIDQFISDDPNAPFIIDSQIKWNQFAEMVHNPQVNGFAGKVVKLSDDIVDNLDGQNNAEKKIYVDNDNIAGEFGNLNKRFKGTFDGNGKTIYVNLDKADDGTNLSNGLSVFPNAGGGVIQIENDQGQQETVPQPCKIMNLNIVGNVRSHVNINTDSSYDYSGNDVGGKYCAGFVSDPIGYLEITNCTNGANIYGKVDCGGIISHSSRAGNNITIVDCINKGNIMTTIDYNRHPDSGNRSWTTLHGTGGIIGFIGADQKVTLDSCKNLGNIRAASNVGGIVGVNNSELIITNSANEGNIRAQRFPTFKVTKTRSEQNPHIYNYEYTQTCVYDTVNNMDAYIKDYHIDKVSNAGGILGSCFTSGSIKVYASYNSGDVTAGCLVAGGIVGSDTVVDTKYQPSGIVVAKSSISVQPKPKEVVTDIKYCYNTGTIAVGSNGKLGSKHSVGNKTQCVDNKTSPNVLDFTCDTWATREGDDSAGLGGGIIGTSTNTNIDSCYNTGEIISNGSLNATGVMYNIGIGGILGYAFANQNNSLTEVNISYCYSIGNIFLNFYYDYWLGTLSFFNARDDRRYAAPIVGCNATNESNENTHVSHCFGLKYSVDDPYYGDGGKRYDTTQPGNKDWMRTGTLLESLAEMTAVMKEDGEIDAPNTIFRQNTESASLNKNYDGFKNASTSTLINSDGTDVTIEDLKSMSGGAYIYPYGCLPQLAVFGLGTETGLSMLSTTYNKNPGAQTSLDNYIPQTAGSALSPYLINDGIDLLCLEALTNATGDSCHWTGKGKYISFANKSNNIYGNVAMFIDMPSTDENRDNWFVSKNENGELVTVDYDKRNTNRRIFTRGAVLGQDFIYEGEATKEHTFGRWRANNHYFGGEYVANPPVMAKNFKDCKVNKESANGREKFLNLFDDNQNTKFYVNGLNNKTYNHQISFIIDIGKLANLTGFSFVTAGDTANYSNRNPNHITIYGSETDLLYTNNEFKADSWGTALYDDAVQLPAENKATRGFTVNTGQLARYYLIVVTVSGDDFQASEFNMSFDIKHDTSGTVYPNEPFANLIDSDKYSKFYQEGRYFNVKARASSECYLNEIVFITGNNNASLERVLEHLEVYGSNDVSFYNNTNFDTTGWGTAIFNNYISMPAKNHFTCVYPINSTTKYKYYLIRGRALDRTNDHKGFQAHDMKLKFSSDASMTKTNMYSISKRDGYGFEGILDGAIERTGNTVTKKATIENIYMTNNHLKDLGLFSVLNGGTVRNMAMTGYVKSSYASADTNDIADVGAYVGVAKNGATISGLNVGKEQEGAELIASSTIANNNHVGGVVGHVKLEISGAKNTIENIQVLNGIVTGNINAQINDGNTALNIETGGLGGVVGFASEHVMTQAPLEGAQPIVRPELTFSNINVQRMIVWAMSKGANHIGGILGNHSREIGLVFSNINIGHITNKSPIDYKGDLKNVPIIVAGEYSVGGLTSWTNDVTKVSNVKVYGDVAILRTSSENTQRNGLKTHNVVEIGTSIGGLIGYSIGGTKFENDISSYANIDISNTDSEVKNVGGVVGVASNGIEGYKKGRGIIFDNVNLDVEVNINGNMKEIDPNNKAYLGSARRNVGGLVGKVTDALFNGTFNIRPTISANQFDNVGGFIGYSKNKGNVYASVVDLPNDSKVTTKEINIGVPNDIQSAIIGKENVGGFIGKNSGETHIGEIQIGANKYYGILKLNNYASIDGKISVGGIIGLNDQDAVFSTGNDGAEIEYTTCFINNYGKIGTNIDSLGESEIQTGYIGGIVGNSIGSEQNINNGKLNLDFKTQSELRNHSFVGIKELKITENEIKHHSDAYQSRVGGILGCSAGTINIGGLLSNEGGGNIFGYQYVGGSIGELKSGTVTGKLTNSGNVTGVRFVGGNIGFVGSKATIKNNGAEMSSFENNVPNGDKTIGGNVSGTTYSDSGYAIGPENEYIGGSIGSFKGTITKDEQVTGSYGVEFVNNGNVSGFAIAGGSIGELAGRVNSAKFTNKGELTFMGYHELGGSIGRIVNNNEGNDTMMRDSKFEYVSTTDSRVTLTAGLSLKNGEIAPEQEPGGIGGVIGLIFASEINGDKVDNRYKWENNSFYINGNVYAPGCHDVGGVVGRIENSFVNIKNMLAFETNITGYDNVGGIVGYNGSTDILQQDNASLVDCYNIEGQVTIAPEATKPVNIGGIVGAHKPGNTTYSCYWVKGFPNAVLERTDINHLGSQLNSQFKVVYEYSKLQNDAYYTQAKEVMRNEQFNTNGILYDKTNGYYHFNQYIELAKTNTEIKLYDNNGQIITKDLVEINQDYGYYEESQSYSTGTQDTGFFCVYSNDANTLGIGDINIKHTIDGQIVNNGKNNDEAAWKKIANAYASGESSEEAVKSDLLFNPDDVVEERHFYATGTKATTAKDGKNGYFLYGAVSGKEGQVRQKQPTDSKFFFDVNLAYTTKEGNTPEEVVQAENIVLFYKKVKFEFESLNYNGKTRIAPISFQYRSGNKDKTAIASINQPDITKLSRGDYYILLTQPTNKEGVFNTAKNATERIDTYGTIYYVNEDKTAGVEFGIIDSAGVNNTDVNDKTDPEYVWSIKPRTITTKVTQDGAWEYKNGGYTRTYDGIEHGITFTVSGGINGENISGEAKDKNANSINPSLTSSQISSPMDTRYSLDESNNIIEQPVIKLDTYTYTYNMKDANKAGENYQFIWNIVANSNYKMPAAQTINLHISKAQLLVAGWTLDKILKYADETLPQITGVKVSGSGSIITSSATKNNKVQFTYDGKQITINIIRVGDPKAGENTAKAVIVSEEMPNYEFDTNDPNLTYKFNIEQAIITELTDLELKEVKKEYDGGTGYDLTKNPINNPTISCKTDAVPEGTKPNDLRFNITGITFDNPNVQTNKHTVTIVGKVSNGDSNFKLSENLKLPTEYTLEIGVITPHKVTVSANYVGKKQTSYVYNGKYQGVKSLVADGLTNYTEKISDIVSITYSNVVQDKADKTTITMKTNTPSVVSTTYSITVENKSDNFDVTCPTGLTWTITTAEINVSNPMNIKKVYDGSYTFVTWKNGNFDSNTKKGKGSFTVAGGYVSGDDITIEATYFEKDREDYNSFVNGVYKDTNDNTFKIDKQKYEKGIKFVMDGDSKSNYTLQAINGETLGANTVFIDNCAEITPKKVVVTYSNTFQSYINANGALKTKEEYLPVTGKIGEALGNDNSKIEVVMVNNWIPEDGFKTDTIITANINKLYASIGPAGGDTLGVCKNYEISNKPVVTIAYYIQESGAEKVSSLSGLIMASYYYSLNFLGDGVATPVTQNQTIIVGYDSTNKLFYYPVDDPIVTGTAGAFDIANQNTFAYELYEYLTTSLGENNETIIVGSSITMPGAPTQDSTNLEVTYQIQFTPSPKKEFILIKDISGKMTDEDLKVLDGRFTNWGKGTGVLENVQKVSVGDTIVIYDSLFKDTFVGSFDGNNYVIKDIIIQSSGESTNIGLFSSLAKSVEKTVKNAEQQDTLISVQGTGTINSLHLRNVNIRVMSDAPINVGGIIGYVHKDITELINLSFVGDVRINSTRAVNYGGIIGAYEGAPATTTADTTPPINGLTINHALVLGRVRTKTGAGSNIGAIAGKMETGALQNVLEMVEVIHTGAGSNVNLFEGSGTIQPTEKVVNIKNSMLNNDNIVSENSGLTYNEMRTNSTHIVYSKWANKEYGEINLGTSDVLILHEENKDKTNGPGYPRQSTTFRDIVDIYLLNFKLIEKETSTTTQGDKPVTTTSYDYEFGDSDWVTVDSTGGYININNKQKLALVKLLWFANFRVTVNLTITSDDLEFNSEINEVFVGEIVSANSVGVIDSVNGAKITHYKDHMFRKNFGVLTGITFA